MRHPFEVSISANNGADEIIIAKRSTREKAERQAADLRKAIGTFNRDGVPSVVVTDLRDTASALPADNDD